MTLSAAPMSTSTTVVMSAALCGAKSSPMRRNEVRDLRRLRVGGALGVFIDRESAAWPAAGGCPRGGGPAATCASPASSAAPAVHAHALKPKWQLRRSGRGFAPKWGRSRMA